MEVNLKRILIGLLAISLVFPLLAQAENVYRWKDENGKVHFGRTLPPEQTNKPYEILNSAGIVIERVEDPMEKLRPKTEEEIENEKDEGAKEPEPLFSPRVVRLRTDNLLMLRYHTQQDLIDAMENEVAQLGYDRRLINQSQTSVMNSLRHQVKNAADRQRAGMPDDEELVKNIHKFRQRLRKSERSLTTIADREITIRARFEKDLERYRFLEAGGLPGTEEIEPGTEETAETEMEAQSPGP